jgi:TRAP-type C4-dicarboxylate transport system permease small subunit
MNSESANVSGAQTSPGAIQRALCALVNFLGIIAGIGLMAMVIVTSVDVLLRAFSSMAASPRIPGWLAAGAGIVPRLFGASLPGAYDIVRIAGALTIAAALPYTTAIKGHVAIEYFFHKLGRRGRLVVDSLMRLLSMALFGMLAWQSAEYGNALRKSGEVSMTIQLPIFWVPWVLAASCVLVVLVTFYHLANPGKELIKP